MSDVSLINGHIDGCDTCVCCGEDIPEGRMVCKSCENCDHYDRDRKDQPCCSCHNLSNWSDWE